MGERGEQAEEQPEPDARGPSTTAPSGVRRLFMRGSALVLCSAEAGNPEIDETAARGRREETR
jgi:hypothetical protein